MAKKLSTTEKELTEKEISEFFAHREGIQRQQCLFCSVHDRQNLHAIGSSLFFIIRKRWQLPPLREHKTEASG